MAARGGFPQPSSRTQTPLAVFRRDPQVLMPLSASRHMRPPRRMRLAFRKVGCVCVCVPLPVDDARKQAPPCA